MSRVVPGRVGGQLGIVVMVEMVGIEVMVVIVGIVGMLVVKVR